VSKVKERLTGAIILVALIVVLVPELLRGPIRSTRPAAAVAAASGEPPLRSYMIDLTDEHPHGAVATSGEAPMAQPPAAAAVPPADSLAPPPAPPVSVAKSGAPTASAATAAATTAAGTSAATATPSSRHESFMVRLGSFANRANAERLARQVRAQGFAVSVSRGSSGRRLYQVRAGPAPDRARAAVLEQQLQSHGHAGAIVPE
jgi:DedD protein